MSQKTAFCYKNIIRNAKLRKLNSVDFFKKKKFIFDFSPVSHTHTPHNNKNKNNKNNNNSNNNNNNSDNTTTMTQQHNNRTTFFLP